MISITRGIRAQSQAAAYITDTQRIYHSLMKWQHSFISFSAGSSTQSSSFNSVFTTMKKLESTLSTIVRSLLFLLNINQILKCIADALPDFTKQNQHPIFKLSKAKNLGQKHYCSTIHRETWYAKWWSCASSEHVSSYKSWNISAQIYISHNMELGFILKQTSRSNLGIYFSAQVAAHKISEWMGNHKSQQYINAVYIKCSLQN